MFYDLKKQRTFSIFQTELLAYHIFSFQLPLTRTASAVERYKGVKLVTVKACFLYTGGDHTSSPYYIQKISINWENHKNYTYFA